MNEYKRSMDDNMNTTTTTTTTTMMSTTSKNIDHVENDTDNDDYYGNETFHEWCYHGTIQYIRYRQKQRHRHDHHRLQLQQQQEVPYQPAMTTKNVSSSSSSSFVRKEIQQPLNNSNDDHDDACLMVMDDEHHHDIVWNSIVDDAGSQKEEGGNDISFHATAAATAATVDDDTIHDIDNHRNMSTTIHEKHHDTKTVLKSNISDISTTPIQYETSISKVTTTDPMTMTTSTPKTWTCSSSSSQYSKLTTPTSNRSRRQFCHSNDTTPIISHHTNNNNNNNNNTPTTSTNKRLWYTTTTTSNNNFGITKKRQKCFTMTSTTSATTKLSNAIGGSSNSSHGFISDHHHHPTTTTAVTIQFDVQDIVPQYIAIFEGICTCCDTQYQYHYVSDIIDYQQYDKLPNIGYSTEICVQYHVTPGPWIGMDIIQEQPPNQHNPTMKSRSMKLRTEQSDYNQHRIRLVHTKYQHSIGTITKQQQYISNIDNENIEEEEYTILRIDPSQQRDVNMTQHIGNMNSSNSNSTPIMFVGAMAIVIFDGYTSMTDYYTYQNSFVTTILNILQTTLSSSSSDHDNMEYTMNQGTTIPIIPIPSFTIPSTNHCDLSMDHSCDEHNNSNSSNTDDSCYCHNDEPTISGSGGMVLPINIDCHRRYNNNNNNTDDTNTNATVTTTHNDYFLMIYICKELNSIVAIDVVFTEMSSSSSILNDINTNQITTTTTSNNSSHDTSHILSTENVHQHTSLWTSTWNVLQFWKHHQNGQTTSSQSNDKVQVPYDQPHDDTMLSTINDVHDNIMNDVTYPSPTQFTVQSETLNQDGQLSIVATNTSVSPPKMNRTNNYHVSMHSGTVTNDDTCIEGRHDNTQLGLYHNINTIQTPIYNASTFNDSVIRMDKEQCLVPSSSLRQHTVTMIPQITPTPNMMSSHQSSHSNVMSHVDTIEVMDRKVLFPTMYNDDDDDTYRNVDPSTSNVPITTTNMTPIVNDVMIYTHTPLNDDDEGIQSHMYENDENSSTNTMILQSNDTGNDTDFNSNDHHSIPSIHDIYFGLYDIDIIEMTSSEINNWIENLDHIMTIESDVYGMNGMDDENDINCYSYLIYNWIIPMMTMLLLCVLLWYYSSYNPFCNGNTFGIIIPEIFCLSQNTIDIHRNTTSMNTITTTMTMYHPVYVPNTNMDEQLLIVPLSFIITEFGYIGTIRIE